MNIHSMVLMVRIVETELSERGLCWGKRPAAHGGGGTWVRTAECSMNTYMVMASHHFYMNTGGRH